MLFLGSVITKLISKQFSKYHISSYIGLSILVFGGLSVYLDDAMVHIKVYPQGDQIWDILYKIHV